MLQAIRGRVASWIVRVLFVLLIISFVGWGITDYLNSARTSDVIASVGSAPIPYRDFAQILSRERQQLQQRFGPIDPEQARQLGLNRQALDRMIDQKLFDQEARRSHITISDAVVRSQIQRDPRYAGADGQFDRTRFELDLAASRASEAQLVQEVRGSTGRAQLLQAWQRGVEAPAALTDPILAYRNETRTAQIVTVPFDRTAPVTPPEESVLSSYYEAHKDQYMTPEYRAVTSLVIKPDDFLAEVQAQITDADIEAAYKQRESSFAVPEKRTVEQLLLADETKAKEAQARLAGGEDFVAVGVAMGLKAEELTLGAFVREDLPPPMDAVIFALAPGAVSEPVKSGFGWSLFRVSAVEAAHTPSLADMRDTLRQTILAERTLEMADGASLKFEKFIDAGDTLEQAADKLGLTPATIAAVGSTMADPDGKPVPNLAPKQLMAAFAQTPEDGVRTLDPGDGSFAAIRTDAVIPAALKPFDTVKGAVGLDWHNAQQMQLAKAKAEAIVAGFKAGGDLEGLARQNGLSVKTSAPFSRYSIEVEDLPQTLISQMFASPATTPPVIVLGADKTGGTTIAVLDRIIPYTAKNPKSREDVATATELQDALRRDLLNSYASALRQYFPVTIDQNLLDRGP